MKKLEIIIKGEDTSDLELALYEVLESVRKGYTQGFNRNETGEYKFDIMEEE